MSNLDGFKTTFLVRRIIFNNKAKEGNFNFAPEIGVAFNKISEKQWETLVNVKVIDKEEQPFPFDLDVVVSLITGLPDKLPEEFNLKEYLKISSLNILFPYVRSVVTNITSSAMVNPIILPLIDVQEFAKNIAIPGIE